MNIQKTIRNSFFAGLAVVLPAVVTIWVLIVLFNKLIRPLIENVAQPVIIFLLPDYMDDLVRSDQFTAYWNVTGIILLFLILVSIGVITRTILARRLIQFGETILARIPLVNKIYGAVQQIGQAFLGERKNIFQQVVLIEYPRPGLYSLAFVTSEAARETEEKTGKKMLTVFIPTTPNPTSGLIILVPEEKAISLRMTVEEAMKLIISGGVVLPKES